MLPKSCTILSSFLIVFALTIFLSTAHVHAQWSGDAESNLPIATGSEDQAQPKMALLPDGGTYISWFSGTPSGYDVRLQRLDADGNLLWAEAGLLVAQRGFSSTEDYGLDSDESGNAFLVFRDDRTTDLNATAVKISPDGDFLWGENGINVSEGFGFINAPQIAAMPDGGAVVAFTGDGQSVIKGLDSDGSVLWQDIQTADVFLSISDIKRSTNADGNSIYAVLFRTLGPPTVPGRLSAQAYNAEGQRQWGGLNNRLDIMTSGSLQLGIFPEMVPDGLGGVLIYWYQSQPSLQSYVEQIHANGTMRFGSGGFPVSQNTSQLRSSIVAVYEQQTNNIYAFWRETDSSQNQVGLYGQRINENNERSWGEDGISIVDVALNNDIGGLSTFVFDEEPVIAYTRFTGMGQSQILAKRFNLQGEPVWDDSIINISTVASSKSRLNAVKAAEDEVYMSWQDNRNGTNEIWAQNLFADGSLGEREDEPEPEPEIRDVTFSVDMSIQRMSDIFQPENGDLVHVLGSFNGWSISEDNGSLLSPDPGNTDLWTTQLSVEGESGEEAQYKFFIEAGDNRSLPNDGWENNDVGTGENGNRVITLTDEDIDLPVVLFNNDDGPPLGPPHPAETPDAFYLAQNYPNPFNPTTLIRYSLPEASSVRLEVYNSMGQRVSVVINKSLPAGEHIASFDGTQLSSGIYFYRLEAGNQVLTRKMTLIK